MSESVDSSMLANASAVGQVNMLDKLLSLDYEELVEGLANGE